MTAEPGPGGADGPTWWAHSLAGCARFAVRLGGPGWPRVARLGGPVSGQHELVVVDDAVLGVEEEDIEAQGRGLAAAGRDHLPVEGEDVAEAGAPGGPGR